MPIFQNTSYLISGTVENMCDPETSEQPKTLRIRLAPDVHVLQHTRGILRETSAGFGQYDFAHTL